MLQRQPRSLVCAGIPHKPEETLFGVFCNSSSIGCSGSSLFRNATLELERLVTAMTGERKSSGKLQKSTFSHLKRRCQFSTELTVLDLSSRLGVKRGAKITSKASKSSSSPVVTPPKAAIAAPNSKKEEVHRRKNPFNDMLRRGGRESAERGKDTLPEAGDDASSSLASQDGADVRMEERGAELEKELVVAKDEHDLLKVELQKASHQEKIDQATIEDLKHQLAEVRQRGGRDDKRRMSSDQPEDDVLRQNFELRYRLGQLQEQLIATSHGEQEWNELRSRLHATEKESQERLQQLLSLKSSISSLTRVDSQTTDSELTDSFSQLANRVREWVIANFRRSKLSLDNLPDDTLKVLASLTSNMDRVDGIARLALYQAIVSHSLMGIFHEPILVGLPKTLTAVQQCAEAIRGPVNEYREWRRVTIRAIEKSQVVDILRQGKEEVLHQIAKDIERHLHCMTAFNLTPGAYSTLIGILNTAADLQHALALQKAQYQVLFFSTHNGMTVDFDQHKMEPINDLDNALDEDGDTLIERRLLFCVFPCLEKFGDEWGEHIETNNVLLKARVCCGVG